MIWNKQKALEYIKSLKDEAIIEVTEKQEKTIRSLAQNRYWHSVIVKTISNWWWDDVISVHYNLKEMFNLETTTNLSTDEFAFMCKSVINLFLKKYWVRIPLPREDKDLKDLEKYLF